MSPQRHMVNVEARVGRASVETAYKPEISARDRTGEAGCQDGLRAAPNGSSKDYTRGGMERRCPCFLDRPVNHPRDYRS